MMKIITTIVSITIVISFLAWWMLFKGSSEDSDELSRESGQVERELKPKGEFVSRQINKNNRRETIEELQERYDGLTAKEKAFIRDEGLLFPDEVNSKIHTHIEDHKYLQREILNEKAYKKIRLLIDQKMKKTERIIAEHEAFRLRRYGSSARTRPLDFSSDRDENLIIRTPLQAYKHLLKNGRSATGDFPVKYHEDDDFYIFLRGAYKTKGFSEGIVVEKNGGCFFKWRHTDPIPERSQ